MAVSVARFFRRPDHPKAIAVILAFSLAGLVIALIGGYLAKKNEDADDDEHG